MPVSVSPRIDAADRLVIAILTGHFLAFAIRIHFHLPLVNRASNFLELRLLSGRDAEGNLMRLPSGLVGVNEACSGVRSLQTSIMIGLLFGELKRLSLWQRIFLVIAGVAIALFANFLRVLFLVSMASRAHDVSVVNKWHDLAGYGILVLVFVGTMAIAWRRPSPLASPFTLIMPDSACSTGS